MNDRKRLIALATSIVLVISVFSLVAITPARGAGADSTLYVGPDGDYTTIQGAIDNADSGDTILVNESESPYAEQLGVTQANITIEANGDVTLDFSSFSGYGVEVTSENVTIQGFEVIGIPVGAGTGDNTSSAVNPTILVKANYTTVKNCIFTNSSSGPAKEAMLVKEYNNASFVGNEVNNYIYGITAGRDARSTGAVDLRVSGNTFNVAYVRYDNGNTEVTGEAIQIWYGDDIVVSNNDINGPGTFVADWDSGDLINSIGIVDYMSYYGAPGAVTYSNNDVTNFYVGVATFAGNGFIENNNIHGNNIGIQLGQVSSTYATASAEGVLISHNDIVNNEVGVLAQNFVKDGLELHYNDLSGNQQLAVNNTDSDTLNATLNYWGVSDPSFDALVSENVSYNPYFVDAEMTTLSTSDNTDTTVSVEDPTYSDQVSFGVAPTEAEEVGEDSYRFGLVDVLASDTNITIKISYSDAEVSGLTESSLVPQYFDGTSWVDCSDYTINTTANYIEVSVTPETTPALPLTGTAFSLASYNLSVSPDTVIYNHEGVSVKGTLTEGGELLNTRVNYTIYTPEGQQIGSGSTNDGTFSQTIDFIYNDSLNTPYEANYTVYANRTGTPDSSSWEAKFVIQQELDFSWNEESDQPFEFDSTQGFSGTLLDYKGNAIQDYNVTVLRDGHTVEYDNFQDGDFGFTTIINDHADWTLGVTDNTDYVYKYFDVTTKPKNDLDIEFDTQTTVARLEPGDYNITVTNVGNDKYGLINVTGIQWDTAPTSSNISGGNLVANGSADNGDATWLLFNDSDDDGVLNFTAKPNSTGTISVDARYEDPAIETPSTVDPSSDYYDRTGTLYDAATIIAPEDVNLMYSKTWDVIDPNAPTLHLEVTDNETIEVLPLNTTQSRVVDDNRFGTQFEDMTIYLFEFQLKWGSNGSFIVPHQNGTQQVKVTGAEPITATWGGGDNVYNISELGNGYNSSTGQYFIPFIPTQEGDYVTAEIKVNNSGEIVTKTIQKEVDGLTAEISVNDEAQDSVVWGTEGEITATITKSGEFVNNGLAYLSQGTTRLNLTDARTALVNNGSYSFGLTDAFWNNVSATDDLWFSAYWYEDVNGDNEFSKTEVSLAVYENFSIEPADVYDIDVSPGTLTAGVQEKNLTITVTNTDTGETVTDVDTNHTVMVNGVNYTADVSPINASVGKYVIQPADGFVFNSTDTINVKVTANYQTKTGTGTFDVELPALEFEVETFNPENMSISEVFGENFTLTAGVGRTYNVTVTAEDINGELINGTTSYDAEIMLGYVNETGFQNVTQLMTLNENGSVEFEFTPESAKDFVWKVGEFNNSAYGNDSRALVEDPAVVAEKPNLLVLDRAGGEIPGMSLPLGYETELLMIAQQADSRDYLFSSFSVKAEGSIAETNATASTKAQDDPTGVSSPAQVARLTITPTGTGTDAIQITSARFNEPLATLNVTDAVNKLQIDFDREVEPGETVTLKVTDTFEGELIADARVTITGPGGSINEVTDANGEVSFTPESAGDYDIEVRRAGYGPATDVLSVEAVANFSYDVTVSPSNVTYGEQYDITVTVTNDGGAQGSVNVPVEINDQYITTRTVLVDADSQRTFQLTRTAENIGTNTVVVADGQATTDFTVEKQTVEEALILSGPSTATVGETITLTVTVDGSPVQADVTLDGTTKTADTSGQVTFTVTEAADLTFTATKAETETATTVKTYTQDTHTVEVSKQEVTKELNIVGPTELTAGESATYLVKANGDVVEDATVEYNGQTLTTDSTGRVEITYSGAGNYLLTATKDSTTTDEEVITYSSDSISVSVSEEPKEEVSKNLQLSIQTATEDRNVDNEITIKVTADGEAVEDATVTVAGESKTTSSDGTASFTFTSAGTKIISASKAQVETADKITTYQSTSTSMEVQKTPGFTTAIALAAVLGAAFLIYRRKEQ
ncbi:hypothetical protein C9439_01170 [archaeon SCG-AAA382B04]|nr:hypothetical protein C9439_01170 [archaeon SCG-AAA382B04]